MIFCAQKIKNYALNFDYAHCHCLCLDGINSRYTSHFDFKSKESYEKQKVLEFTCTRKDTVGKCVFVTSRYSDRKSMQPIRKKKWQQGIVPQDQEIWNNFSQIIDQCHVYKKFEKIGLPRKYYFVFLLTLRVCIKRWRGLLAMRQNCHNEIFRLCTFVGAR